MSQRLGQIPDQKVSHGFAVKLHICRKNTMYKKYFRQICNFQTIFFNNLSNIGNFSKICHRIGP